MAHRTRLLSSVGLALWLVIVFGVVKPTPEARPEPGTCLATAAVTVRAALAFNGILLAFGIGCGLVLGDDPRPWPFVAVVAVVSALIYAASLWHTVRAERAQPGILRAQARFWWRPERFGWPRATAP